MHYTIPYAPTPKQRLFHEAREEEVLFGGAAGGGKTRALVMDALMRVLEHPGTAAYLFRRTYPELEDTVLREALALYPASLCRYNVQRREFALPGGSRVLLRACQRPADMYQYRGAEIQFLYIDELTTFPREVYDFLRTRLRAKKSLGVTPAVRCATNPGGIGHGWVKKYFVDSPAPGRRYIPALIADNPHIGRDYALRLQSLPEPLRRAYLLGDWDAFEGQAFPEWRDDPAHYADRRFTHVIAPFAIPLTWRRFMSFDHGYSRPFSAGWWAVDPEGRAYRYREWYGCEPDRPDAGLRLTPRQIAEGILAREEEERRENLHVIRVADPAIFDESRGESVARQMEPRRGLPGVYFLPGDHARLAGKLQLHERLRFDASGRPGLQVFSTCRGLIRTLPALPLSALNPEDVDTAAEDHAYDEARYFLMMNPLPAKAEEERGRKAWSPYE